MKVASPYHSDEVTPRYEVCKNLLFSGSTKTWTGFWIGCDLKLFVDLASPFKARRASNTCLEGLARARKANNTHLEGLARASWI